MVYACSRHVLSHTIKKNPHTHDKRANICSFSCWRDVICFPFWRFNQIKLQTKKKIYQKKTHIHHEVAACAPKLTIFFPHVLSMLLASGTLCTCFRAFGKSASASGANLKSSYFWNFIIFRGGWNKKKWQNSCYIEKKLNRDFFVFSTKKYSK